MIINPTTIPTIKCRFECEDPAVGIFHVPEGCICWKDPIQALCAQHLYTAESTGDIRCIVDFRLPKKYDDGLESTQADRMKIGSGLWDTGPGGLLDCIDRTLRDFHYLNYLRLSK